MGLIKFARSEANRKSYDEATELQDEEIIIQHKRKEHLRTPRMVQRFAKTARERIRIDGGGYRRDHLRALAQRVEVADREVRIIGSKSSLLQTLTAAGGVKSVRPAFVVLF
jgi:hypothetical protein